MCSMSQFFTNWHSKKVAPYLGGDIFTDLRCPTLIGPEITKSVSRPHAPDSTRGSFLRSVPDGPRMEPYKLGGVPNWMRGLSSRSVPNCPCVEP